MLALHRTIPYFSWQAKHVKLNCTISRQNALLNRVQHRKNMSQFEYNTARNSRGIDYATACTQVIMETDLVITSLNSVVFGRCIWKADMSLWLCFLFVARHIRTRVIVLSGLQCWSTTLLPRRLLPFSPHCVKLFWNALNSLIDI